MDKWIQEANLKKGALRVTAKREGAITQDGTISIPWLKKKAKGKGKTARRAKLALKLRGFKD